MTMNNFDEKLERGNKKYRNGILVFALLLLAPLILVLVLQDLNLVKKIKDIKSFTDFVPIGLYVVILYIPLYFWSRIFGLKRASFYPKCPKCSYQIINSDINTILVTKKCPKCHNIILANEELKKGVKPPF